MSPRSFRAVHSGAPRLLSDRSGGRMWAVPRSAGWPQWLDYRARVWLLRLPVGAALSTRFGRPLRKRRAALSDPALPDPQP